MAKKALKSYQKTSGKLRKFVDGGLSGRGPLQPEPKKELTSEEAAKETVSRLTNTFGISKTETPKAAATPKAKPLAGGFKDQAQKDSYIRITKNLLKTKSVSDLVKMKHGTAAGLSSLGFKDEVKKAAPVAKAPVAKKASPTLKAPSAESLKLKNDGLALKAKGQKQAEKYRKLGGAKQALKLKREGSAKAKEGAALKKEGEASSRAFKFVLNDRPTYGRTKDGKGSIETTRTERKNGDKQTKVRVTQAGKTKTYYKDEGHRSIRKGDGTKVYINKSGTRMYEKRPTGINSIYTGKGLHVAPKGGGIKGKMKSKHTAQLNGEYVKIFGKGGITKSKSITNNKK